MLSPRRGRPRERTRMPYPNGSPWSRSGWRRSSRQRSSRRWCRWTAPSCPSGAARRSSRSAPPMRPCCGPRPTSSTLPAAAALAGTASGIAAAVAALLGWQLALRADLPVYSFLVAPVIAAGVAVLVDRLHSRVSGLDTARITAGALGVLSTVAAVVWWVILAALAAAYGWVPWQTDAFAPLAGQPEGAWYAALAGLLIAALLFLAPSLRTPARQNARLVAASMVVLSGAAAVTVPALLVGTAILVAAAAVFLLTRRALRPGASVSGILAVVVAYAAATATPALWLVGIAVAVAVAVIAQVIMRPAGAAAVLLTLAPLGVLTISAFLAPFALAAAVGAAPDPAVAPVFVQWIALASVLCAVVLPASASIRSTLAATGCVLFVISLAPYVQAGSQRRRRSGAAGDRTSDHARGAPAGGGSGGGPPRRCWRRSHSVVPASSGCRRSPPRPSSHPSPRHWCSPRSRRRASSRMPVAPWLRSAPRSSSCGSPPCGPCCSRRRSPSRPPTVRAIVDLGALATVLALAWDVPPDLGGPMLAVIAAGIGGASVSRGWAAPASDRTAAVRSTTAAGVATADAPRRLLAWPAIACATAALWFGLSRLPDAVDLSVEAYVVAPAVGAARLRRAARMAAPPGRVRGRAQRIRPPGAGGTGRRGLVRLAGARHRGRPRRGSPRARADLDVGAARAHSGAERRDRSRVLPRAGRRRTGGRCATAGIGMAAPPRRRSVRLGAGNRARRGPSTARTRLVRDPGSAARAGRRRRRRTAGCRAPRGARDRPRGGRRPCT